MFLLCVKRNGLGVQEVMDWCHVYTFKCVCLFAYVCVCVCVCVYIGGGISHLSCFMPQEQEISYLATNYFSMNKASLLLPRHVTVTVIWNPRLPVSVVIWVNAQLEKRKVALNLPSWMIITHESKLLHVQMKQICFSISFCILLPL